MSILRVPARAVLALGAVGSLGLTLYHGRQNASGWLVAMFVAWVLSPFVGLAWAGTVAPRWPAAAQATLHGVTLMVAAGSLAIYGNAALWFPGARPASRFLIVPLGSWVLIAATTGLAALLARRSASP